MFIANVLKCRHRRIAARTRLKPISADRYLLRQIQAAAAETDHRRQPHRRQNLLKTDAKIGALRGKKCTAITACR